MRLSSMTLLWLNGLIGVTILLLASFDQEPESRFIRMPLWFAGIAIAAVLIDRRLDKRL